MLHVTMKKYVSMSTSRRHFLIASGITKYKKVVFFFLLSLSNHLLQPKSTTIMKWINNVKAGCNAPAGQLIYQTEKSVSVTIP